MFRKNYKDHIKTKHPDKDPNNLRPGTVPTLASFLKRKNKDSNNARKRQRSGDSGVGDEEETVTPAVPVTGQEINIVQQLPAAPGTLEEMKMMMTSQRQARH